MTLAELHDVARKTLPEGTHFGVSQFIDQDGYGTAGVYVHHESGGIERSIYRTHTPGGDAAQATALALVEGRWDPARPAPATADASPLELL